MSNQVFICKDGFINHVYEGDQTYEIVMHDVEKIILLSREFRDNNKPVKVLVDYTNIGTADAGARKAGGDAIKILIDYDKIALFGTKAWHTLMANLIILATGRSAIVKVFETRTEAINWLNK